MADQERHQSCHILERIIGQCHSNEFRREGTFALEQRPHVSCVHLPGALLVIQYFKSDTARTLDGLNDVVSKNYDDRGNDGVMVHTAQKE